MNIKCAFEIHDWQLFRTTTILKYFRIDLLRCRRCKKIMNTMVIDTAQIFADEDAEKAK